MKSDSSKDVLVQTYQNCPCDPRLDHILASVHCQRFSELERVLLVRSEVR